MQFSYAAVVAVMAAAVSAHTGTGTAGPQFTTEVVTSYTTYCPGPTTVAVGGKTYTVTEATVLTITDCPCTISKPVVYVTPVASPAPYSNTTVTTTHGSVAPIGTGAATTSPAPTYATGAGSKAVAGMGGLIAAAVVAVFAL